LIYDCILKKIIIIKVNFKNLLISDILFRVSEMPTDISYLDSSFLGALPTRVDGVIQPRACLRHA